MSGKTFAPNRAEIARCFRKRTRWEVAHALGVTVAAVRRWERGERTPSPEQVIRLAFFLGYPLGFFYAPDLSPLGRDMQAFSG